MHPPTRRETEINAVAERQMRTWSQESEVFDRLLSARTAEQAAKEFGPFLAFSREAGTSGGLIADLVGKKLGWEVMGKSLLDEVAERYQLPRRVLEWVDEKPSNWFQDVFGAWLDPNAIPQERYIRHLRRVVLRAAYGTKVVFIGRGAQFFLPRHRGIAVRVIAPEPYRVRRIAEERGISEKEARQRMRQTDLDRAEFVRRYFRRDIDDPHLYDLVVNVEHLSHDRIADEIARFCATWETSRGGRQG